MDEINNLTANSITLGTFTVTSTAWNFCPHCGRKIESGWRHCAGCGVSVGTIGTSPYIAPCIYPYVSPYITWGTPPYTLTRSAPPNGAGT